MVNWIILYPVKVEKFQMFLFLQIMIQLCRAVTRDLSVSGGNPFLMKR